MELQFAEYLQHFHCGSKSAVISRELEQTWHISGKELRDLVNALRRKGVPIASDQNGYFYAETKAELKATIRHMKNRITGINAAIRGLNQAFTHFDESQTGGGGRIE